jgi:hypothetical protein
MRDVLAVCGLIVLSVCLGITGAYLSVDLTPPGLDLLRPTKPEITAQLQAEERQETLRAQASDCKHCATVADLAQRFARHARIAREQASALKKTIAVEPREAGRQAELQEVQRNADSAEAAAAALTGWASRCRSEDFCRIRTISVSKNACTQGRLASVDAAYELAAAIKKTALACAGASCPQIDCQTSATLRSDVFALERSLGSLGGRTVQQPSGGPVTDLPVGPSTFAAEIRRVSDEATYLARMLPVMLESARTSKVSGRVPRFAAGLVDDRAILVAQISTVMEHSAELAGNMRTDLRNEAAWRLKSLAASLTQLGRETEARDASFINWRLAADHLGAALLEVARLQAILGRAALAGRDPAACASKVPEAAQQLRQALAMLDLCRMRSACVAPGTSAAERPKSQADLVQRARKLAASLSLEDAGRAEVVAVASTEVQRPIDMVRSQFGVCLRPETTPEVSAQLPDPPEATAPAVQTVEAPRSPQDLVSEAESLPDAASGAPPPAAKPSVIQAVAPAQRTASQGQVLEVAAPSVEQDGQPTFSGSILSPGGGASLTASPEAAEADRR